MYKKHHKNNYTKNKNSIEHKQISHNKCKDQLL